MDNYHLRRAIEGKVKPVLPITCEDYLPANGARPFPQTVIRMDIGDGKKLLDVLESGSLDGDAREEAYDSGYDLGVDTGYDDGHADGVEQGFAEARKKAETELKDFLREMLYARRDGRLHDWAENTADAYGVTIAGPE